MPSAGDLGRGPQPSFCARPRARCHAVSVAVIARALVLLPLERRIAILAQVARGTDHAPRQDCRIPRRGPLRAPPVLIAHRGDLQGPLHVPVADAPLALRSVLIVNPSAPGTRARTPGDPEHIPILLPELRRYVLAERRRPLLTSTAASSILPLGTGTSFPCSLGELAVEAPHDPPEREGRVSWTEAGIPRRAPYIRRHPHARPR